jgi:N-acetyl-anhydromuramyl-L-alanine amidase AmpD
MTRLTLLLLTFLCGCASQRPGAPLVRRGDEIMVCGQLFHTGAPVILWTDPGGYDAYRVERRFVALDQADWKSSSKSLETPNRFSLRNVDLSDEERERVRGGGWDLPLLQRHVDQFVIHYDVAGTSRACFRILHDQRDLSVHFMLDIDGTIYQTLDVKERAWHATTSNDRSVGIEIANIGAYPPPQPGKEDLLAKWYARGPDGRTRITLPSYLGDGGVRTPAFVGHPARDEPVEAVIQGEHLRMYDLTPQQYESLIHLTATLCTVLPRIRCDCPRGPHGTPRNAKLPDDELKAYSGLLGHYHIQSNKVDPGPAFDWDKVIDGARRLSPD